jgi:hypothetical protein
MDILQKKHAFDQIEMYLTQVKDEFIEQSELERDQEIDDLKYRVDELQDDLEKEEELSEEYKNSLRDIGRELDKIDETSDIDDLRRCIEEIKTYL